MYEQPKSLLTRVVEAAFLFALAAWLVWLGIRFLGQVWVPLVILVVLTVAAVVGYRIWKHYKDTHF
jgi:hypothetical protein